MSSGFFSDRRTPPPRTLPSAKTGPGANFLLIVEGDTEDAYFRAVCAALKISAAHVHIANNHGGCDPAAMVASAAAYSPRGGARGKSTPRAKSTGRKPDRDGLLPPVDFDQVWIVFDFDAPKRDGKLASGLAAAKAAGVLVAGSDPCFEFWLSLHTKYSTAHLPNALAALAHLAASFREAGLELTYAKDTRTVTGLTRRLIPHLATAYQNALKLEKHHAAAGTDMPTTGNHRLLLALNFASPHPTTLLAEKPPATSPARPHLRR